MCQSSRVWGKERNLTKVCSSHASSILSTLSTNCSANQLWDKEWEFGGFVPDLVRGKQGDGHLRVLSKS